MVSWGEQERSSFLIASNLSCSLNPVDLTVISLFPTTNSSIHTITHNLFKHGVIPVELVSASFELATVPFIKNGELIFVRINPTKFTGPSTSVYVCGLQIRHFGISIADLDPRSSITRKNPANRNWGIGQYMDTRPTLSTPEALSTFPPQVLLSTGYGSHISGSIT